jgi:hypothetical protein
VSILFIKHLQGELIEKNAEILRLKELLYGKHPDYEGVNSDKKVDMRPIGGFIPRAEVAKNIKLKLARVRRQEFLSKQAGGSK